MNLVIRKFLCLMILIVLGMVGIGYCLAITSATDNSYGGKPLPADQETLSVKSVKSLFSSLQPWAFHSSSGRLHLLFLHLVPSDTDCYWYYHTYELENGTWSTPQMVPYFYWFISIIDISLTENGFIIYYTEGNIESWSGGGYKPFWSGFHTIQYDEQANVWDDPIEIFGKKQLCDHLKLPEKTVNCYFHSFYLNEDQSFYVVCSFNDKDSHEYERKYLIFKVDQFDTVSVYPILNQDDLYSNNRFIKIVPHNDFVFLYTLKYTKRAILFTNGTITNWRDTNITGPYTHFVKKYWRSFYSDFIFKTVLKHYFIFYEDEDRIWYIVDLACENPKLLSFYIPNKILPAAEDYRGIDFEPNQSSSSRQTFVTALVNNDNTLELWEFEHPNNTWKYISSLDYVISGHSLLNQELPTIDVIVADNQWRIFWDQNTSKHLNEIFTVSYNPATEEWSPVIQVTYVGTFTYLKGGSTPSFFFLFALLGLVLIVLFMRKFKLGEGSDK